MNILLSLVTILAGLLFAGSVSYSLVPKSSTQIEPQSTEVPETLGTSTQLATPSSAPAPLRRVTTLTPASPAGRPTPSPTLIPTPTLIPNQTIVTVIVTPTPTAIPQPSLTQTPTLPPSPTPTPTPVIPLVNVEIKEPGNDLTFSLSVLDGLDACQLLQQAKHEDKISSLTLDDRYLSSFNTLLVKEIDGFQDNWVFTVNGDSPMGCSLVNLHNLDTVVWEYLTY